MTPAPARPSQRRQPHIAAWLQPVTFGDGCIPAGTRRTRRRKPRSPSVRSRPCNSLRTSSSEQPPFRRQRSSSVCGVHEPGVHGRGAHRQADHFVARPTRERDRQRRALHAADAGAERASRAVGFGQLQDRDLGRGASRRERCTNLTGAWRRGATRGIQGVHGLSFHRRCRLSFARAAASASSCA